MAVASIALVGLLAAGCSAPSKSTTPKSTPVAVVPVAPVVDDLQPVNSVKSKYATAFVRAMSLGGDGSDYIASNVRFNSVKVRSGLRGCKLSTSWYAPASGSTLSGEMDCGAGDLVAVDITFDTSNKITMLIGQGASTFIDSSTSGTH
jgi:hypothetical protein